VKEFQRRLLKYNLALTTVEDWSNILQTKFHFDTTVASAVPKDMQDKLFKSVSTTIHQNSLAVTELQTEVASLKAELSEVKGELVHVKEELVNSKGDMAHVKRDLANINATNQKLMQLLEQFVQQGPQYDGPRTRKRTSSQVSPMASESRNVRSAVGSDSSNLSPLPSQFASSDSILLSELSAPVLTLTSLPQATPTSHPGCIHVFEKLKQLHFKELLHVWISKKLTRESTNWVAKNKHGEICPQNKYKVATVIELLMEHVLPEDVATLQNPETTPETVACLLNIEKKVNEAILDFKKKIAAKSSKPKKVRPQFKPGVTAIYGIIEKMKNAGEFPFHTQVSRHSPSSGGLGWDISAFFPSF
jgi:predicted  nucleic acid-binding Zn-ribbon protein